MASFAFSKDLYAAKEKEGANSPPTGVIAAYALFGAGGLAVYHFIAEGEFSAILTLSVIMQCLAVVLLVLKCHSTGSAAGISARALGLEALALVCRLSSTLWLNGYLPVDASGDHIFQAVDICTLGLICWLLWQVCVVQGAAYQEEEDTLPVTPIVLGSLVAASILHADMNDRPLFDTLWMTGLFVGVLAVLPQLWVVTRGGGRVEALTSHYIAAMALARVFSGIFMWHARFDLTCRPWVSDVNHASWAILGAHLVHLLLLGDFAYYYVKCILKQGLQAVGQMDVCTFV